MKDLNQLILNTQKRRSQVAQAASKWSSLARTLGLMCEELQESDGHEQCCSGKTKLFRTQATNKVKKRIKRQSLIMTTNKMIYNQEKNHFYWLDALRFIAAFMVLLSHTRNTFFPAFGDLPTDQQNIFSMAFTMFCRMGHEAVIIFFVLSGFLVGGRGLERIQNGTMNVKSYAIDRFTRIYPPLIAAVVFYFITSLLVHGEYIGCVPFSWTTAIGNLLNLQGICCQSLVSPFWSLSYEMWFYIIFGVLAVLLTTKNDYVKIVSIVLFVLASSVFVLGLNYNYLFIWLMGAIAYIVRPKTRSKLVLFLSLVGFFVTILYWQLSKDTRSIEFAIKGTNNDFLEILMSLMACLFIQQIILFEPQKKFTKRIEKGIGNLAKFSYTLYLSHRIVFLWIMAYLIPYQTCQFTAIGIIKFIAILIITTFICWLIYLVSERYSPYLRRLMKNKLLR